jgi:hypothetical protein
MNNTKLTENNKDIEISKTNTQHLRMIHQKTILIVRWLQFKMTILINYKILFHFYPQVSHKLHMYFTVRYILGCTKLTLTI